MNIESGVSRYIHATATVYVHFPVDHNGKSEICCRQCFFFRDGSNRCALNHAVCEFPNKYVGSECPLNIIEESEIEK